VFGSDQAAGKRSFVYISAAHWYTNGKISTHQFILPKEHSKWTCLSRRMLLTLRSVRTYHRYSGFQGQRTKPGMESSILLAPDRILSFKAVSKFSVPRSSNINFRDPKPGIINLNRNLLSGRPGNSCQAEKISSIYLFRGFRNSSCQTSFHWTQRFREQSILRVQFRSASLFWITTIHSVTAVSAGQNIPLIREFQCNRNIL